MIKFKSEFNKNVFTLIKGTAFAQLIVILISPILTRLYTPEEFGIFALYSSLVFITASFSTGKYELAIMFPKKKNDALAVMSLSLGILVSIVFCIFLLILGFNMDIAILLENQDVAFWLYFLPLSILMAGTYRNLNYFSIREKKFSQLSTSKITQSLGTSSTNLIFGFLNFGVFGLVFGNIFGFFISNYILYRQVIKENLQILLNISRVKIYALARLYIKFPKYDMPASFINTLSRNIIPILLVSYFSPVIAGYYYLTQRVIALPSNIIASSISDVFRQRASEDYRKYNNAKDIYISTLKKLIIISFIPSIILFLYSKQLFILIFGANWEIAGQYTQILAPLLFFRFISTPLSFMFTVVGKQSLNLIGQIIFLFGILISFYIGTYYNSDIITITCISFFSSLFYFIYTIMSYKMALGYK
jgi:O-antigen/teichoic acid export membrane protein